MRKTRTSGLMSGDTKRSGAPPPRVSSTLPQSWRIGAPNQRKSLCHSNFSRFKESAPMPTECSAESFDFGTVEGRAVEAAFDAGLVTSDAGALLLKTTDRAIGLIERFAACFYDERRADLVEHEVGTLVGQRVFAIAL